MQRILLFDIGINNDVIGVKTSSYWYCLTRIRVAASQIYQGILYQDYSSLEYKIHCSRSITCTYPAGEPTNDSGVNFPIETGAHTSAYDKKFIRS